MSWFNRKKKVDTESIDVDATIEKVQAAKVRLAFSLPRVNELKVFFETRQTENGFGDDFELTLDLRPKGTQ